MDKYIGTMLDNRYEILDVIGTGGMAVVYKAKCTLLNRFVAIKILKDEFASDGEFRRRFHTESQAVAMLSHPNIVSVYDVSRSDNVEYIVMELIEGVTLKDYMERKGALSTSEVLHFTPQIASALDHAHSRGIIHRDIKPQNILILRDGTLKVTDFGIARISENQQETMAGDALGSVHYVSPEQARGSKIDARSDIYSLGIVMYEMLTGELPFTGETPMAVVLQHLSAVPPLPSELRADIPVGLEEITMKAMANKPDDRYSSAADMLSDLELCKEDPSLSFGYVYNTTPYENPEPEPEEESTQLFKAVSGEPQPVQGRVKNKKSLSQHQNEKRREYRDYSDFNDDYDDYRPRARTPIFVFLITGLLTVAIFFGGAVFIISSIFGAEENDGVDDVVVPSLIGHSINEILTSDEYSGYTIVENERIYSNTVAEGIITAQEPSDGRIIKSSTTIYVTVSNGARKIIITDVLNLEERSARLKLEDQGFTNITINYEISDSVAKGYVISVSPDVSSEIGINDPITLTVSLGPDEVYVKVPDLMNVTKLEVEDVLEQYSLILGDVFPEETNDEELDGLIFNQSIKANTEVLERTSIDIYVYQYVEPAPEVNPGGNTQTDPNLGSYNVVVPLDKNADISNVRITSMGEVRFEGNYMSSYGNIAITIYGTGSEIIEIYVNDVLVSQDIAIYE